MPAPPQETIFCRVPRETRRQLMALVAARTGEERTKQSIGSTLVFVISEAYARLSEDKSGLTKTAKRA